MKTPGKWLASGLTALILNLIWEFSHHFLYIDLSGIPKYPHLIMASLIDTLIILGIVATISLKNRGFNWMSNPKKTDYLWMVLLGFVIAVLIEAINLNLGRWAYTAAMPTIYGIGISPLIQLALTGIASIGVTQFIQRNS